MKKTLFIILFILILLNLNSTNKKIEFLTGINYYEEAHIVISLTQILPLFMIRLTIEKEFKNFSLKNEFSFYMNIFSIYFKNGFVYYTDKTLNVDIPFYYNIIFDFKINQYFSLFTGIGTLSKFKYNRYSSGLEYWQQEIKYSLLPLFIFGCNVGFNRYKFLLSDYFSISPAFIFQYKKDDFYTSFVITNIYNNFRFEFLFYLNKKWYMIFSYNNFLDLYIDILSLFIFVNFNNSISVGFGYGF